MQDNLVIIQVGNYSSKAAALQDATVLYSIGFIK
jgi:hypothetical protein